MTTGVQDTQDVILCILANRCQCFKGPNASTFRLEFFLNIYCSNHGEEGEKKAHSNAVLETYFWVHILPVQYHAAAENACMI